MLAMRLLTLYENMDALNINLKLFTFGAPSVLSASNEQHANGSTLQRLNDNTFNFVNRFDVIPRMLGRQFEALYPHFVWKDQLLLNHIKSFQVRSLFIKMDQL